MWYLQDLMDAAIRQIVFRAIIIFIIGFLVGFFVGCDTPYSGTLGPDDFDGWITEQGDDFVCLENGFDSVCIKTMPGTPGKDGKDGISIVGPQGLPGKDGQRGKSGVRGRPGKDGAIVIVQTPYLLLETDTGESFTLMISHGIPEATSDTYVTPVATVEVPIGGGEPVITPMNEPVSVTPVAPPLPIGGNAPNDDSIIWHVMYRVNAGQATVFVYPRCFNNPYHNPPRPPCENDYGITEDLFFEVSPAFDIELQGDRESVRYLLGDLHLAEDSMPRSSMLAVSRVS